MVAGDGFAYALGEGGEGFLWEFKCSFCDASAEDDAAVGSLVYSISCFQHWTAAGKEGVVVDVLYLLALVAARVGLLVVF